MPADPPTLFLIVVVTTFTASAMLLWSWFQNPPDRTLLWAGAGYAVSGVGSLLLVGRGTWPDFVSVDLATGMIVSSFSIIWSAARVFNGRPPRAWVSLVGPALWLIACRIPGFYATFEYRVIVGSTIIAVYCLMAAWEFVAHDRSAGRERLAGRFAIVAVLGLHAVAVLARIPVAIADMSDPAAPFERPWFGPVALEAIVFAQMGAFLIVALTKSRVEAQLRSAALTDPLTGLPNRRAMFERGTSALGEAARERRPTAVIVFDLDRFKAINDTFGHPVGDAVIRAFAAAAETSLRRGDAVGRIGGEEFAAVLPGADEGDACVLAARVMARFVDLAATVEGCPTACTVSAGVVASKGSVHSIESLIVAADRALYEAKRQGGARFCVAAAA